MIEVGSHMFAFGERPVIVTAIEQDRHGRTIYMATPNDEPYLDDPWIVCGFIDLDELCREPMAYSPDELFVREQHYDYEDCSWLAGEEILDYEPTDTQ